MRSHLHHSVALTLLAVAIARPVGAQSPLPVDRIKLPPGFAIETIARVPNARAMTWGDQGTLFVGSSEGRVFALMFPAPDCGGTAAIRVVASGLRDPAGVAFRN